MNSPFNRSQGGARVPGARLPRRRLPASGETPVRSGRQLDDREAAQARDDFNRDPRRSERRGGTPSSVQRSTGPARHGKTQQREGVPLTAEKANKLKKRRRRRKIYLVTSLTLLMLAMATMGAGYAALDVPLPDLAAAKQVSVIYYADGKTELARLGLENREEAKLRDIPKHVQHAVIAAEDRSFYENDGVSISGTLRAFWNNVRGKDTQGGSTITQQYVKNAFLTQERTFSRKTKEIILARKMDQEYSKDQILEYYLNTIFWGRGAYGIQAAAKAYFGVSADKLTVEQSALLAGVIKSPNALDPETNPVGAQQRWSYVIAGMASKGWIDKAKAETAQMPTTIPRSQAQTNSGLKGATGTIMTRVQAELAKAGISEQQLNTGGLRVTTNIDAKMQKALEGAVKENMAGQPKNLATGVVAVQPGTGKIKAYYGGENGFGQFDVSGPDGSHPAGSSMKIYALAQALEQGISIDSVWDGSTPRSFPDRIKPVNNSEGNNSCKRCTLDKATVLSLNTAYYALTSKVGASNVAKLAARAGITHLDGKPTGEIADQVNNNIGIGQYGVSVIDHAAGFATFANGGVYAKPRFVDKVSQGDSSLYQAENETKRAFSADAAADADTVLQHVVQHGQQLVGDRPAAAKTGTHQYLETGHNSHAWMGGFTPQLAAAVWVGNAGADGPIIDKRGRDIYGAGVPGSIWKSFMNAALAGVRKEEFPAAKHIGDASLGDAPPEPAPAPTPAPEPTEQPSVGAPTDLPVPENFQPGERGLLGVPRRSGQSDNPRNTHSTAPPQDG